MITEAIIRSGDKFHYNPWGGECTAMWVSGELWMARNTNQTNGVQIWKTISGGSTQICKISSKPTITILWDNTCYLDACMPNENIIRVWHGTVPYDFQRVTPIHSHPNCIIRDGDSFSYSPWGGRCVAHWVNDELWMARDLNHTDGTHVWKAQNGNGHRLLNNGVVHILWDNHDNLVAFMPDPDTIRVWHGAQTYDFIREIPIVSVAQPIHSKYYEEDNSSVVIHTTVIDSENINIPMISVTASSPFQPTPITTPVLSLEMAKFMVSIAQQRAVELGVSIVVSVYDNHGNLKLFERMDGTSFGSIRISQMKGLTSASFPMSSRALCEKSARLSGNPYSSVPDLLLIPGGLPIILRNTHIGSIGVSGATPDIDEQCAQAGINGLSNHYNSTA